MAILNVPIQLNRGTLPSGSNNSTYNSLLPGEPFFDMSSFTLYIKRNNGAGGAADINITGYSDHTRELSLSDTYLFRANRTNGVVSIGGFRVNKSESSTYTFSPENNNNTTVISDFKINALRGIVLREYNSSTNLGPGVYGTKSQMENIKNPAKGQLFFALA